MAWRGASQPGSISGSKPQNRMVLGVNALGTWDAAMADFNGKTVLGNLWLAANAQSPAGGLRWPIFSFLKYFWARETVHSLRVAAVGYLAGEASIPLLQISTAMDI